MPDDIQRIAEIPELQRRLIDRGGPFPRPGRVPEGGTTDHRAGRPGHRTRPEDGGDDDNFNPDGSRKDRDERKPTYDVELICRTFVGDVGNRPLVDTVFWESPDIWIEGSSGDPDIATPGEVNQVKVHVWNFGLADSWGAHIDLYWCDPSVGINPAVAHPIGSTVIPLAAGQHKVVSFDWIPTPVNDGHSCLVAQVYDPVSDPLVAPFNPVQDRHVGQRNISVVEAGAGNTVWFDFLTQNLSLRPAVTALQVERLEGRALETVALALDTPPWRSAEEDLAPRLLTPKVVRRERLEAGSPFATGVFRETIQGVPRLAETRRLAGALRALVTARPDDDASSPGARPALRAGTFRPLDLGDEPRRDLEAVVRDQNLWRAETETAGELELPPGHHLQLTFETRVPEAASAAVYRIVERTAGEITGGITLVVRPRG